MSRPPARDTARPTTVAYVAGTGRSGSTLFGNALGSWPGAVSVGEVKLGFRRGLVDDGTCGCRLPVRECPVWVPALEQAFGSVPTRAEAADLDARLARVTRTRTVPRWLVGRIGRTDRDAVELADLLGRLLAAVAQVSGASVVVDSSKLPAYGVLLAGSAHLDVRTVHLVRDPRAVAWSWQRQAASQQVAGFEEDMERFGPVKSGLMWLESSASVSALARRDRRPVQVVRYEDLVADPARVLARAASFVGLPADPAAHGPVTDDGLRLRESHAIAGNPNRVRSGPVRLRRDDEWVTAMPTGHRRVVSTLTAPRRWSHGY